MFEIKSWSTTANSNTAGFAEQMAASAVNDSARDMQAALATWYRDAEWVEYGKGTGAGDGTTDDYTATYVSATQFRIASANVTAAYHIGRRVRATGSLTGTIYGTITATSYPGTYSEITVAWDDGSLQSETLRIYLGSVSAVGTSWPLAALEGRNLNLNATLQRAQARDTRDVFVTANPSSNTITLDLSLGDRFKSTLNQNVTTVTVTNWPTSGQGRSVLWIIQQDGTGSRTLAFPAAWKWPSATVPSITSTANGRDRYALFSEDGGTTIDAITVAKAFG